MAEAVFKKLSASYESVRKQYKNLKRQKFLSQAMLYCSDTVPAGHVGASDTKGALLFDRNPLSDLILSDTRFKVDSRGYIMLRATSKLGPDNGPSEWKMDADPMINGYVIWKEDKKEKAEPEGLSSDESWSSDDSDNETETESVSKIPLTKLGYKIMIAQIPEAVIQELADENFKTKNGMAEAYLKFSVIAATVSDQHLKKFLADPDYK
jgi:hypothetical protein